MRCIKKKLLESNGFHGDLLWTASILYYPRPLAWPGEHMNLQESEEKSPHHARKTKNKFRRINDRFSTVGPHGREK